MFHYKVESFWAQSIQLHFTREIQLGLKLHSATSQSAELIRDPGWGPCHNPLITKAPLFAPKERESSSKTLWIAKQIFVKY